MLLVLTVVVMASVLGMSYLSMTTVKVRAAANLTGASRALYLAESGLHHGICLLRTGNAEVLASSAAAPMGPFQADGSTDSYLFYAQSLGGQQYAVVSSAAAGGITRSAVARIELDNEYRTRLAAMGPVSYWRMGESGGNTAMDQEGAQHGRYQRPALGRPGALLGDGDTAAGFDGRNDRVELDELDVPGWSLTLATWFRAESFDEPEARLISKATGTGESDHWWMLSTVRAGGRMRLRGRIKALFSTRTLTASSGDLEAGQWVHAVLTYDGFWMKLYKDGELVGQGFNFGWIPSGGSVETWIGNNPPTANSCPFHGDIDEMAVFNRALSAGEIRALHKARVAQVEVLEWVSGAAVAATTP